MFAFIVQHGDLSCWKNVCTKNKTSELPALLKGIIIMSFIYKYIPSLKTKYLNL